MKQVLVGGGLVVLAVAGWWFLNNDASDSATREAVRADGSFDVVVSFYPLQYAVERIGGDLVAVTNIGAGRDPHDYRPSTQDVLTLQQADLVVMQGAEFEPWGHDIKQQLETAGVPVVLATAGLTLREGGHDHHHDEESAEEHHDEPAEAQPDDMDHGHEEAGERHAEEWHEEEVAHHAEEHDTEHVHEGEGDVATEHTQYDEEHEHEADVAHAHNDDHDHGTYDPHTWVDPVLFSQTVANLTATLVALDPEHAEVYEANATALQAELAALDAEYQTGLASCTYEEAIVSHDAFSYLAERYGLTMHAIAGLSTQDMPSTQTLATLRAEAAEGVGGILLEENAVTAYGETLARETGLQTFAVNPVAYVIPEGEDYLSVMRANLESLQGAYQCNES